MMAQKVVIISPLEHGLSLVEYLDICTPSPKKNKRHFVFQKKFLCFLVIELEFEFGLGLRSKMVRVSGNTFNTFSVKHPFG